MTIQIRYTRSTEHSDPQISVDLNVSLLELVKLLFGYTLSIPLSEEDIDSVAKYVIRWRLVKKLRSHLKK